MTNRINRHIIYQDNTVREILSIIDKLGGDGILFLCDKYNKLIGTLTDGDIRRGIIRGLGLEDKIEDFIHRQPEVLIQEDFSIEKLRYWREKNYKIIPVVDTNNVVIDIINFRFQKSYLPIDAVIMAGGKGTRLRPLTLNVPKPLLKVGEKPIIEYNIDRLKNFGIQNINISINYLGEQLVDYFKNGMEKELNIKYIEESHPLGTIGAASRIKEIHNEHILVMNSDLLTNIDYEEMFSELLNQGADMIVATTPYEVKIPYGVIETEGHSVVNLVEKPTYTYYSNAGIYILKKEHLNLIPQNQHFNATDLLKSLYSLGKKVVHFPILGYWLDIGKPQDFEKAQRDIKHIKF